MTTRYDAALLDLSEQHLAALEVLATGGTHAEAAAAAGVHRVTVTKWSRHHAGFIAERNRRKLEVAQLGAQRARRLVEKALEVVSGAVDAGDNEMALAVLKWVTPVAVFGMPNVGPTDPVELLDAEVASEVQQADPLSALLDDLSGSRTTGGETRRAVEARHLIELEPNRSEEGPDTGSGTVA